MRRLRGITIPVTNSQAIEVPLPLATFHCSVVSAAVYNQGTPLQG